MYWQQILKHPAVVEGTYRCMSHPIPRLDLVTQAVAVQGQKGHDHTCEIAHEAVGCMCNSMLGCSSRCSPKYL